MTPEDGLARAVDLVAAAPPSVGPVRLVCVDGPAGSGKSTFSAALAAALRERFGVVPVVHADELDEGWDVVAGASDAVTAFDGLGERVVGWLLEPWRTGGAGRHPVWDWASGAWGGHRDVPAADVVILDGVGLGGARVRGRASLLVWLDAGPEERRRRVADRDGADVDRHMDRWRERESAWFAADGTEAAAGLRIRT